MAVRRCHQPSPHLHSVLVDMEDVDEDAIAEWGRQQKVLAATKHRSRAQVSCQRSSSSICTQYWH